MTQTTSDSSAETAAPQNRLARSTSPYLRQHETNPVHWYEWGPEALQRAQREDKPILLSVGYSACHWCHVMAHESFEDPQTAALLNEHFVSIKVDREERPDIDAVYQKVVALMGQGGGWPLTVFLTPQQQPFYGGTYFPKEPMYGRPSFRQVLVALADLYRNKPDDVRKQTAAFMEGLHGIARIVDEESERAGGAPAPGDPAALRSAGKQLVAKVDDTWGGLGRAPKFPNPTALEILARLARRPADDDVVARDARDALRLTLDKMYHGGIYDHLRGGFARYSVDRVWLVPHFEKMLYDNAQLLPLYAEAAVLWPEAHHLRRVAIETVDYLVADMRSEDGLFYSATDADSEGEEGKYFCWTPDEVSEVLGDHELADVFCTVYGVQPGGNFEHGWSILNLPRTLDERAVDLGMSRDELDRRLDGARAVLLQRRYERVPPLRDEKVLTAWNALLVSGLCRASAAARAWGDPQRADAWQQLAETAGHRLVEAHVTDDGRVLRSAFEGKVHIRGFIEDVAFLGRACLDLHELTLRRSWLQHAEQLAEHAKEHYARPGGDGFLFTADDAETLIERTESAHDGPIPSGVAVVTELLLRLDAAGAGPSGARATAEAVLRRFRGAVEQPFGYAALLTAAAHASAQAVHVTVRGPDPTTPEVVAFAQRVRSERMRSPVPVGVSFEVGDAADAVVCRGQVCTAPLGHEDAVAQAIRSEL